jgi:methylthioribulose-1-phosphate dehydratase
MVTRLTTALPDSMELRHRSEQLCKAGHELYLRGMVPATSGNFSARLRDGHILITESGAHKGRLQHADLLVIDSSGHSLDGRRPSAETALHLQLYRRFPEVNAVLHPHSVNATLLSRNNRSELVLQGYELLKAFPGITTHDTRVTIPNFPNDQDIERLSVTVEAWMQQHETTVGYLISGHGFYTWGDSVNAAMRHVEALEFLFECELRQPGDSH